MAAISIEQIVSEWKVDSKIDEANVERELFKTPNLHAKYLEYYIYMKAKLASSEKKYNMMGWQKRKYFRGEMEKQDLEKYGWSQWNGLKPSSSELNQLLDMDSSMNELLEIVTAYKTSVQTLEYILKSIQGRDWLLKTIVDYQKYVNG